MNPAIKIKNLGVNINGHKILKNISTEINPGTIVGLLGPSGAGKTTLIRSIVGRQQASSGQVVVFDLPAGSPALRSQIGYTPQSPAVYPDLSVRENINYFAAMSGYSKRQAREVIEEVDLIKSVDKTVNRLSGGQKSRVSLAVALLGRPRLLVLDEPTVGVDPVLREHFWRLFKKFAQDGTTLIVTSHVMEEANHCQSLILIRNGSLLATGTPKDLREKTGSHTIEDAFIKLVEAGS